MAVYFEWDESKNRTNIVKHGISSEKARNAGKVSEAQTVS